MIDPTIIGHKIQMKKHLHRQVMEKVLCHQKISNSWQKRSSLRSWTSYNGEWGKWIYKSVGSTNFHVNSFVR
eukprot:UN19807